MKVIHVGTLVVTPGQGVVFSGWCFQPEEGESAQPLNGTGEAMKPLLECVLNHIADCYGLRMKTSPAPAESVDLGAERAMLDAIAVARWRAQ